MNSKKFIKFLILTLILFIIFVPFINYDNGLRCITIPCNSDTTSSILLWAVYGLSKVYSISYFNLIIGLIVSIAISSTIIILWNKRK